MNQILIFLSESGLCIALIQSTLTYRSGFIKAFSLIYLFTFLTLNQVSAAKATAVNSIQEIAISITDKGFEPKFIQADPDKPTVLKFTRTAKNSCATTVQIVEKKITRRLPLNKAISIKIGKLEPGELHYSCKSDANQGGYLYIK